MKKPKVYRFVIDGLTAANADKLKLALSKVNAISGIKISPVSGILEVKAGRAVHEEIDIACRIAGVTVRTEVKNKGIFG